MQAGIQGSFNQRFRTRVALPGALILLLAGALCSFGLVFAGHEVDEISLEGQRYEAWRAILRQMDELSLAQESIGLCERCIENANHAEPDLEWLHDRVALPMFELYRAQETYILDGRNRPLLAAVNGQEVPADRFQTVAPVVERFIALARGEIKRPGGKSNFNERLPGSPLPEASTVRTSERTAHSTDLVRMGDRIGIVSVMQMAGRSGAGTSAADAPLLVSLRWMDDAFLADLVRQNFLTDPRISASPQVNEGETSIPIADSERRPMTHLIWKPARHAGALIRSMLPAVLVAFGIVALLVALMSLKLRSLMRQEDKQVRELEQAHVELKAREAQAHHLAYHDPLTGLPNRARFNDDADRALLRARRGEPMAILLLDLDRFKDVNDRFGHLAGDALIREVAKRLSRVVRGKDLIARLGGDEFAVLLHRADADDRAEATLERIVGELRQPFEVLGNQAHVGVSIGVALAPEYGAERTELMRKADIALYRAKDEGRGCYRFFTGSMDEAVQLRAVLEAELRCALASGQGLEVCYQPLIGTSHGRVTGLEALLRWDHPVHGRVPPHLFVPVAEETGLISQLGDWVLQQACEVAHQWPKLSVAVNLSPVQFCDEGFADRICAIVRGAGVDLRQIELEVTESVVLDQNETVRGALRRLREEGFRVALDDFGTGYSSLSCLREFEVDRIKIDKSFVQNLGQKADADAIVTAVISLGHAMGLQVTAEGVETPEQEDFLRRAGCNVLQGFLFSKAVPAGELTAALGRYGSAAAA